MKKILVICLGLILIMSSFVFAGRGLDCDIDDCTNLVAQWDMDTDGLNWFDDTFDGPSIDSKWREVTCTDCSRSINNEKLRMTVEGDGSDKYHRSRQSVDLVGDFDIRVDWDAISFVAPSSGYNRIQLGLYSSSTAGGGNYLGIDYLKGAGRSEYRLTRTTDGVNGEGSVSKTLGSSKFRVVRSGTTITGYYWESGAWQQIDSYAGFSGNIYTIDLIVMGYGGSTDVLTADFDNFEIISDNGYLVDSLGENNGSSADVSWVTGKFDSALSFDGDDFVSIDGAIDDNFDNTGFSISLWVKPPSTGSTQSLVTQYAGNSELKGYDFRISGADAIKFTFYGGVAGSYYGAGSADSILVENEWQHIVGVWNDSISAEGFMLYLDGELLNTTISSGGASFSDYLPTTDDLNLGRSVWSTGPNANYSGLMDDVLIWSKVLSASDVLTLYNLGVSSLSSSTEFNTSLGTTDFSAVSDIESVSSMTLAKPTGKIIWSNSVNAKDQDFDTYVTIDNGFVSVDSSNLDSSLNSTATITLEDVGCGLCSDTGIFYSASATSKLEAQSGEPCGDAGTCSGFSCTSNDCTFTVSSFSGYAYGGSANLTINDSAEGSYVENDTSATFYAYYINATDGSAITGATCTVDFDDGSGSQAMSFDTDHYEYTKTAGFTTAATHDWNVSCSKTGYTSLFAEDTISVQAPAGSQSGVPEFSTWTLLIGMLVIIGGFFAVKQQE